MDDPASTTSVSKGCFVFKNGATRADKSMQKLESKRQRTSGSNRPGHPLSKELAEQPFYNVYRNTWQRFESEMETLQRNNYTKTLEDLVSYVASAGNETVTNYGLDEILPTAALLTGINQTDHLEQFETLAELIREQVSASVSVLQSQSCSSLKAAIESLVYNFIEAPAEDEEDRDHKRLRRSQCTMRQLKSWYENNYPNSVIQNELDNECDDEFDFNQKTDNKIKEKRHTLVVVLPDFECFAAAVLQDLILILSSHCAHLPFVLILGVATTVSAIHNSLPYHVTSKIRVRIFKTPSAMEALNEMLERVVLSPKHVFHLSGKAFKFLTHIFLYYDFSIHGFIQGFKYCLMEHFFQGNAYALCTGYSASLLKIKELTHDDMETIRRLLSFRPYVEGINDCQRVIAILTDDNYLKKKLPQLLADCHRYFILLRIFLEFITELVSDLPKCPLGKLRRELYVICLNNELTAQPEFKECWQMLSLLSKQDLLTKISKSIDVTVNYLVQELKGLEMATDCAMVINKKMMHVKQLLTKIENAGTEVSTTKTASTETAATTSEQSEKLKQVTSRHDLKERLLQMSKQEKPTTEFARAVTELLTYIEQEIVHCHLTPLQRAPPLHELFVFSDIATVRHNIIGSPRAALHMALNNPHYYLQCKCCALTDTQQLLPTLPDLSIVYKLHLECGRLINMFDWLQAFRSVVECDKMDDSNGGELQIDPQIQARFTRAVAELQFLGFIKMSNRKTDHATRLTW